MEKAEKETKRIGSHAIPPILKKSGVKDTEEKKEENPGIELMRTALNRPAEYIIRQPGPEVIAAYLYVMYRCEILSAEQISKMLKQSQLDVVKEVDHKFRVDFLDEEEEIEVLNMKIENSSSSSRSPEITLAATLPAM